MSGLLRTMVARRRIWRALLLRGVSVVDGRHSARHPEGGELAHLILGEGLGGVEEQGPRLVVLREAVQRRQREAERLAAGRAGGDDDVGRLPSEQIEGPALVAVELRDALRCQRVAHDRREVVRQVGELRRPRGLVGDGDDLLSGALGEERAQRVARIGAHGRSPAKPAGASAAAHVSILASRPGSQRVHGSAAMGGRVRRGSGPVPSGGASHL